MATAEWDEICLIEKGVPIPPKQHGRNDFDIGPKVCIRRLALAEIGDSILIRSSLSHWQVSMRLSYYRKTYGHKYTVRKVKNGIRVWRIK